jgi:tetratricopeptide (TPR) repeat protein
MGGRRHLLLLVSGLATAVGLALAGGAWWHHTSRPEYRLRRGREALRRGDDEAVEREVLRLEAAGCGDQAHLLRAELLFARAKPYLDANQSAPAAPFLGRALDECNQIRDQGDIRLDAAAVSGLCLLYLKEYAQAERALTFVVAQRPDHADAHRGLFALYYDQGALLRAVDHLREVARLDPDDGRPHRMIGHIYQELEKYDRAGEAFEEALRHRLSEEFAADVRENLAECLVKQGRHEEALRVLDGLTAEGPGKPKLMALRAECLLARGATDGARPLVEETLAREPRSVDLLRLRARLHRDAGELREEAADLEQLLTVDRHDYAGRYQLAQVYELMGRRAEAAEQRRLYQQTQQALEEMTKLYGKAVQNPWDGAVRRRLAEICRDLDRPDQAAMWLQAAAACGPTPPAGGPIP